MNQQHKNTYLFFWLGLCAAIVVLYWSSLHSPFVYDDKIEVIGNRTIRNISDWKAIASYNPSRFLLQFTYAANLHYSNFDPFGYHILNLIIHCLSTGAALWMCLRIHALIRVDALRFPIFPMLVVGLWSLHPMGSESVIYITGRSESLCALFSFLSIGSWATALSFPMETLSWNKILWYGSGFICTLLACITKEVGLMLPFVLLSMEAIFTKKIQWKHHLPFALLILFGVSLRLLGLLNGLEEGESSTAVLSNIIPKESDRGLFTQLLTQAEVWIRYSLLWIIPWEQTIYHHIPDRTPNMLVSYGGTVGWLLSAIFFWKSTKDSPVSRFAIVAGALLLLPSSSFVPLKENMAEHRSYQWGLFFLLSLSTMKIGTKDLQKTSLYALFFIFPLGLFTHKRSEIWSQEITLWKEAIDLHPDVGEAWYGYGDALRFSGDIVASKEAFETCVKLDETYLDGWINLGITRAQTNDIVGAAKAWKHVLKQKPNPWKPSHCKAHNNLGFLAGRAQEWDHALTEFHSTLSLCPNDLLAHFGLGEIHYEPRFDKKKAIYYYERLLFLDPTFDNAEEVRKKLLKLTW